MIYKRGEHHGNAVYYCYYSMMAIDWVYPILPVTVDDDG